jgi:Glycosyltransferase family 87
MALTAGAVAAYAALSVATSADYGLRLPVSGDNAAPAINALAHGDFGAYLSHQPLMGLLSLLLRAPVAWLSGHVGGSQMLTYRLGALVCMLPTAALATWLAVSAHAARVAAAGLVAAAIVLAGPTTSSALGLGHPEELLAATLAAASMLLATRDRPVWAGLAAGAAIGTKEWALIVTVPMLLALSHGRLRAAGAALVTGFALAVLPALLDPSAFMRADHALGSSRLVTALSAWWPARSTTASASPLAGTLPLGLTKTAALGLGIGATLAAALLAGARDRLRRRSIADAFALLCALAVVRCIADPAPVEYYYVAAVIPLAAWEVGALRRMPVAAMFALASVWLTFAHGHQLGAAAESVLTLAWAVPLLVYLAVRTFRPGRYTVSQIRPEVAT